MQKTSIKALYRWKMLSAKRSSLVALRRYSTGPEQAAYRAMLEDCTKEMEALTPRIMDIFRRIRRCSVMRDIVAIYFGDASYQEWAEICGVSLDIVFSRVNDALDEIDHEIEIENKTKVIAS